MPHKRQGQVLEDTPNLHRWFEAVRARPATVRAYAKHEPFTSRLAVTEAGKSILFGQTSASVTAPRASGS